VLTALDSFILVPFLFILTMISQAMSGLDALGGLSGMLLGWADIRRERARRLRVAPPASPWAMSRRAAPASSVVAALDIAIKREEELISKESLSA
jgi:hypothetical protein